jgi:hypothetical protein
VLGPEGAAKLSAKSAGIISRTERIVIRYDPELSFKVASSTSVK